MGLRNMSLAEAATVATTGGTPLTFTDNGVSIQNGLQVVVPTDTDYATRRQATFKVRPAALDPKTGAYGKDKKSVSFAIPIVFSDGRVIYNTIRIEREISPQLSSENATELLKIGAQLLTDTDTAAFWASGSLS